MHNFSQTSWYHREEGDRDLEVKTYDTIAKNFHLKNENGKSASVYMKREKSARPVRA